MKINIPVEKSIFGKKARLDVIAGESLSRVINFAGYVNSDKSTEEIDSAGNDLSDYYYGIINSIDNYMLPFWWEDFFSIQTELKSLVSQLMIFTNKIRYIKNRTPFNLLLKREILILEKVKKYFSEIIPASGEVSRVFIEGMSSDIRALQKSFIDSLKDYRQQSDNSQALMVFDIFEKANLINERIVDSINRINLGAAV